MFYSCEDVDDYDGRLRESARTCAADVDITLIQEGRMEGWRCKGMMTVMTSKMIMNKMIVSILIAQYTSRIKHTADRKSDKKDKRERNRRKKQVPCTLLDERCENNAHNDVCVSGLAVINELHEVRIGRVL